MPSVSFDELPLDKSGPPLNAWGHFGAEDELGRLNLITPEVVKAGLAEVRHGITINLNLPLTQTPLSDVRIPLAHHIIHRGHCNDDEVTLNTQTTSQWDGFRHYPYQNWPKPGQYVYYNGMSTEDAKNPKIIKNGIHKKHGMPRLNPLIADKISLETIKGIAAERQLDIRPGDIVILHTGFFEALFELDADEQEALGKRSKEEKGWCGVEATEEMLRWHWDNGIAAVATDTMAYESFPLNPWPSLHQTFLGGWGLPIGELFDTRKLAQHCRKLNQYTFFFTSMPLNVPGGIASPPNAQAIL